MYLFCPAETLCLMRRQATRDQTLQVVFLAEDRAVYVVLVCLEASLEVCQVEFQEGLAV